MTRYVTSVGMEVHAELLTESKMFCRCAVAFGGEPNTRVCPVCLGMPGTLPVPNRTAIEMVLRTALAFNCKVAYDSVFHRKNYFYPDLPKGYQVSQYGETNPLGYWGYLEIPAADGGEKRVKIRRIHLEEDTGKLLHLPGGGSGVDYNRAGVPLMEIVTDFPPDITSPDEARDYLVQLRLTLLYLGVTDGRMEQGSLRCEPNISIRPEGSEDYGTKTELKNLNSFRSVQLGVEYETKRQAQVYEDGGRVLQETRGWNEGTLSSYAMRTKETEADYRYFPCPDLIPMHFDEEYIEGLRASLPELPLAKQRRYQREYALSDYDAGVLVADQAWAKFFEEAVRQGGEPKAVTNWMNGDFMRLLKETGQSARFDGSLDPEGREVSVMTPAHIVDLADLTARGVVNSKVAKTLLEDSFQSGAMPSKLVEERGLTQISDDSFIRDAVAKVIAENPGPVENFRGGKEGVIGFLVGAVMKATQGRANPAMVQQELRDQLGRS
ncbi:MAG: Asp-tRNA(Asn)/Glu-tRNA(Gln) amidotransferase subunit GatB [Fimbriimonadaceae bacterium]|nr:Asp-tRNA(Asn)/Glu-tRNA(Gln) amidotransferase subunit GatB [Fimbriimonadaceae bacterium]QYK56973.1 MAG: Asp-tRNA(Asn)/Glu-tRNA(Gln) amidotransferase subunit GatB [Fimbriimonadaceae bacterium]